MADNKNIETLKEMIVASTAWIDNEDWPFIARYTDLWDEAFGVQICAGICLYYELHPEVDPCTKICEMDVYDLIDEVLAEDKRNKDTKQ